MKELKVVDKSSGQVIVEKEFSGGFDFTYASNEDDGTLHHVRNLDNGKYDKNHWIKSYLYRPIAEKIILKFKDDMHHIRPAKILFLEDTEWEPGSADWNWRAKISKANKQLQAMTGYEYVLETRQWYTKDMSREQMVALIFHELKHIDIDGGILHHDIEDWDCMVATLGSDWAGTRAKIADILADDFEWEELRKVGTQVSIFDNVTPMRVAK